jgi:hypothetical protein
MVKSEPIPFAVGDVVRLKKPHPCGGLDWSVVRLGADIGVKCQTCGRRVLLPRRDLERRIKLFVARAPEIQNTRDTVDPPPSGIVGGQAGS